MVVHDYFIGSTIPVERSPVKHNAFFRTSRSSSRNNKKWCVCGKPLTFFKEASAWACTECGHAEYAQEAKQQQAPTTTNNNNSSGIGSIDGLSDARTTPNRGATKFRHIDPRKRFLRPRSQLDPELQRLVDEQGVTIVRYEERIEQSNDVVTSGDLRANK